MTMTTGGMSLLALAIVAVLALAWVIFQIVCPPAQARVRERISDEARPAARNAGEYVYRARASEKWEQVFHSVEWGIAVGSADASILEQMNPVFARMLGYDREELEGRPLFSVFAPSARDELSAHIVLARSRSHHSFESVQIRKDGSEFPSLVDVTVMADAAGTVRRRIVGLQDITERKAMEQALRDSERMQRMVLEAQRELISRWRPDTTLEFVNRSYADLFGLQPHELVGKRWLCLLPDAGSGPAAALIAGLATRPRRTDYEHAFTSAAGERCWIQWTFIPLLSQDGRLTGFQSVGHDITARKAAEEALAESERKFRAIFNTQSQITCLLKADGTVLELNRAAQAFIGMRVDDAIGLPLWEAPWCKGRADCREQMQKAVARAARGQPARAEMVLRGSDGRPATIDLAVRPVVEDCEGGAALLIAEGHDVTDYRRAERAALEREARLQGIAGSVPGIVFEFVVDGDRIRMTYVSQGVASLCGVRAEDLLSGEREFVFCVCQEDRPSFAESLRRSISAMPEWNWSGRVGREGRGEVWVRLRAVPRVAVGEVFWDGVMLDITELKARELEIAESHQALRELGDHRETVRETERKHIAREIHDELGQNLTALRMGLAVLATREDAPDVAGEAVRLKALVDKSIGVVRSVASSLRPSALDMGLAAALASLGAEFQACSGVPCRVDAGVVPPDMDDGMATDLFRIVQESLTNVMRHAGANHVWVMLRQIGHYLVLEIRDDGRGFDVAAAQSAGGFGLMGIRERALMMGGKMNIQSKVGQGTVVSVSVPIGEDRET
ncbi:MAG: PAS domain S-box protein [Candidatus Nitricoxidivorans perseverans]|uniref:Oxygen sensor histidine kinase NreB n=1 Tax=Candidatus Nitricoxidivorans perseverans TaxID=2975601 RepID=A0AA49FM22_9PROT|nr:MAG: PAS domain S-box protein [Candidatus Nitricoxidivorans perseverans]